MLITPSATPYDILEPEMIAAMPIDGEYGELERPAEAVGRMAIPSRHHA